MRVQFVDSPTAFLRLADEALRNDVLVGNVVVTSATRLAERERTSGLDRVDWPRWWALVRDERDTVLGVAMRTAPMGDHPAYVLGMPDPAALLLARALHERGERVSGVNGVLPASRVVAEETARLGGGSARLLAHLRLFEATSIRPAPPAPGALRPAGAADIELVEAWLGQFSGDADEQAGRPRGVLPHETPPRRDLVERLEAGTMWLWEDPVGHPVHLTASGAGMGIARIGPVFTPRELRGRGYAGAAVGAVSQQLLDRGLRVCLFTDQANPTSNRLYESLGFRAVADTGMLEVR